jgi:phage terminase large subunit
MTSSAAAEVADRRWGQHPEPTLWTFAESFRRKLEHQISITTHLKFPDPKYAEDPVGFFREILGLEPWSRQIEVLEAVCTHNRVAVCSGHKVGKSNSAAGIALWFYSTFADARVVMTSTTSRQVDQILWRELRMMRARGGRCVACKRADPGGTKIPRPCEHSTEIEGYQGELARTGLKSVDFREIVGFTAKEAEAVAGISGHRLLYIVDEASGVDDQIFEAIEGNRAGGAKILLLSNGTRNEGEFYAAFTEKSQHYYNMRISSEESPNVVSGLPLIPGLATREWIEEKKLEWGEDSPLYKVRVKGLHAEFEDAKIFPIHIIALAEQRWSDTPEAGRLFVGLDPAGESGMGDDSCFCARRGLKQLALETKRGLNDDQHLVQLLLFLDRFRLPREIPVVVLDRDGSIGASLFGSLRNYTQDHPHVFELVAVRSSDRAIRRPQLYDRVRDELAANLEGWLREGGAILENAKLSGELHALEWKQMVTGRLKVTPKDVLRKLLGRSPDRYDATALSVWEPLSLMDHVATTPAQASAAHTSYAENTFDPYHALDPWRR